MVDSRDTAEIVDALLRGEVGRDEAIATLRGQGIEDLGFARLDHDRVGRRGFPEVIYGPGKTPEQAVEIFGRLAARNPNVLCTRTTSEVAVGVRSSYPEARFEEDCGLLWLRRDAEDRGRGPIAVVTAGTSDQAVAHEAQVCAEAMGNRVSFFADVGVAGLSRVLEVAEDLRQHEVVICVAGLEAALPSVVAGLVDRPVIGVPTSVGYGATFDGLSALLGSLTACAAGVVTVNIDNGFGAAYAATLMNRRR
jgi:NCAIR mutase (PurE)-related protein